MPLPGLIWRHVVISTRNTWLHGDQRGFRSRQHRIHSSGDYRHLPPPEEHAGLRRYRQEHAAPPVTIPPPLWPAIGIALAQYFRKESWRVLAIAVMATHIHSLVELPADPVEAKRIIGRCKGYASYVIRTQLPGGIWAGGGSLQPIRDRAHQINTLHYILHGQGADAWTWRWGDPLPDEPSRP